MTGVPRSGTTWLARLLALSRGAALAGREPMNPRGRQYALGGTLTGWTRLSEPTPRQRRLLRAAYRGRNPWVHSRYGHRQWAAPLPGTTVVVKDPYALLSTAAVARATGARPVLVYRHPGAVLASYRRVGWTPRLDEVARVVEAERPGASRGAPRLPGPGEPLGVEAMAWFWSELHWLALADAARAGTVVVSHGELAAGGPAAGRVLADHLGLTWSDAMAAELARDSAGAPLVAARLHNLERAPAAVAEEWRTRLEDAEVDRLEELAGATLAQLDAARLRLG